MVTSKATNDFILQEAPLLSSASAIPIPMAMIPGAISGGAMVQTAGGWTSWPRKPAGQSPTWDRTAGRFPPLPQPFLLTQIC